MSGKKRTKVYDLTVRIEVPNNIKFVTIDDDGEISFHKSKPIGRSGICVNGMFYPNGIFINDFLCKNPNLKVKRVGWTLK